MVGRVRRAEADEAEDEEDDGDGGGASLQGQVPGDRTEEDKEKEQVDKPKAPGVGLKAVAKLLLGRDIQVGTHDSFEDALASRDIVHYFVDAGMAEGV